MIPEWLIDDTADVTEARVFIVHTREPRFVGELLPDDEHDPDGVTLAAPFGQTVCRIDWIDPPEFNSQELLRSMAEAIRHHGAVRGTTS